MKLLREASPAAVSWRFLSCRVHELTAGETISLTSASEETLLVLVAGSIHVAGEGIDEIVSRETPFGKVGAVVYFPPRFLVSVTALAGSEIATGSAPADGRFAARVVRPEDMSGEVRGGGSATRQVVTTFAAPIPAERLMSYEAWVPRGSWTGWPPHRHDGLDGSPYLEETYYYRFDRAAGFGIHRNFDLPRGLNDLTPVDDRSLVAVPSGYHLSAAGPGSNAWILNFLAGQPEDRDQPPLFDSEETWIADDWSSGAMDLPAVQVAGKLTASPESDQT